MAFFCLCTLTLVEPAPGNALRAGRDRGRAADARTQQTVALSTRMSSKVQASLAAVEAAASEQRRYFHVHKPDAPVTTVPWRDAWVHHENTRTHNGLHVAHCIVGQPRSIVAPEMRAMLRRHLFERFRASNGCLCTFDAVSQERQKLFVATA